MRIHVCIALALLGMISACSNKNESPLRDKRIERKIVTAENSAKLAHFNQITLNSGFNTLSKNYQTGDWRDVATFYKTLQDKYQGNDLEVLQRLTLTLLMSSKEWEGYGLVQDYTQEGNLSFAFFAKEYERLGVSSMPTSTDVLKRMGKIWEKPRVNALKEVILAGIVKTEGISIEKIEDKAVKELKALKF